jgi:predicted TIM-barrel fold metal-dependent hydrolase
MAGKVIDCFIDLGGEKDALDRCPGFKELYWTGGHVESNILVKNVRDYFKTPFPQIPPLKIEHLIENMDAANVKYAVLQGMDMETKPPWKTKKEYKPFRIQCPADYVKEVMDKYPGRFKGIAGINPFKPRETVLKEIEHYVKDWGFSGIKLLPFAGFKPDDKELLYPIYELCTDLDAVVVIMSSMIGIPFYRWSYAHPLPIDDVAQDFPDLKIHMLHGGERPVWGWEALAICFHSLNVNMCTSPMVEQLWTSYARFPELLLRAQEMIPDKVMFASDWPSAWPIKLAVDTLDKIPGLTAEFKRKMFYENAAKFYGFE